MGVHARHCGASSRPTLLAVVDGLDQALQALDEGADLIDATACTPHAIAAIHERLPARRLWTGVPADPVSADRPVPGPGGVAVSSPEAAVAVAAISTWLGTAAIRTRHVRPVRRAIDMTAAIRGTRPPALTVRGLA